MARKARQIVEEAAPAVKLAGEDTFVVDAAALASMPVSEVIADLAPGGGEVLQLEEILRDYLGQDAAQNGAALSTMAPSSEPILFMPMKLDILFEDMPTFEI
jgi:hypothetical protein